MVLFVGCSQHTVMATSVVELAGNKTVVGWDDTITPQPIKKCNCLKQKIKYNGTFKGKNINHKL
jgi:hypothetical protein